jgi:hypothetical protein
MPSFFHIWRHLLPSTVVLALALVLGFAAPAAAASRVNSPLKKPGFDRAALAGR